MVVISMNVLPQRAHNLKRSIPKLVKQCDVLKINLVNFDKEPEILYNYDNIEIHHFNNVGSEYKFVHYNSVGCDDYYFTVDDDILYPDDYVDRHIDVMESYESAITCVHGSILNLNVNKNYNNYRKIFLFAQKLDEHTQVHICGSGTTCIKGSVLNFSMDDFDTKNMDDYYISSFAKEQNVGIVCMKRERNWMQPMDEGGIHIWGNTPNDAVDKLVERTFK